MKLDTNETHDLLDHLTSVLIGLALLRDRRQLSRRQQKIAELSMRSGDAMKGILLGGIEPQRQEGAQHTHRTIRDRLSDYLDGSLGRQDQAWLEVHLSTCSSCGAFARSLESTVELVHRLPRAQLPAADRARLRQRIVAAARGLGEAQQEAVGAAPGNPGR